MTTKLLIPYSMEKASPVGKSFIAPIYDGDRQVFVGLENLKPIEFAAVVYIGRDIAPEDLFAKIVNTGLKILPSVDGQMDMISDYFDSLSKLKIGDVVKLELDAEGSVHLVKQQKPKSNHGERNLP